MLNAETEPWQERVRLTLEKYEAVLLRTVTARLVKARTPIPADELIDRCLQTLLNPPQVDRRLRESSEPARLALTIMGLARCPQWKAGHLLTMLAALGHGDALQPLNELFQAGLLFPVISADTALLTNFDEWPLKLGVIQSEVFALPEVIERARNERLNLPDLTDNYSSTLGQVRTADGLEFPIRLGAVTQLVAETPVRITQSRAIFKRDLTRLQTHDVLSNPPADHLHVLPDAGVLCLYLADGVNQFTTTESELQWNPNAALPDNSTDLQILLASALTRLESWDPVEGYVLHEEGELSPVPSATMLALFLLASTKGWVNPDRVADYLWEHHPSWQGALTKDSVKLGGKPWVKALVLGLFYPMGLVDVLDGEEKLVRLSALGKHLFTGAPKPAAPPSFPQTLLVQPNGEILAYRQGLTPPLITKLSHFARWKAIGSACTLELTPEQCYRGLEAGLTLSGIVQTLNQHGTRPVPPAVMDLLQRWANKRERISLYTSATLVEFQSPAELDQAIARGIVAVRVTNRIGLCSDGGEPDFKHLRLTGNRDYEAKPSRCMSVAEDGITLTIDGATADLLLEADIVRLAELIPDDPPGLRRFRMTPSLLKKAVEQEWTLEQLDAWFLARAGVPLPPAARLFVLSSQLPHATASRRVVLELPSEEVTAGLMQWPNTKAYIEARLGPCHVVLNSQTLSQFREALAELGIVLAETE